MNKTKTRQKIDDALREIELGGREFVELDDLEKDTRRAVSRGKRKSRGLNVPALVESVRDLVVAISPVLGRKPKARRKSTDRQRVETHETQEELERQWRKERGAAAPFWKTLETKAR